MSYTENCFSHSKYFFVESLGKEKKACLTSLKSLQYLSLFFEAAYISFYF